MISAFLKKYNSGHARSVQAKRNIMSAFLIKGGSVLVALALVPLTINYVNPSEYGIWLTLSSIIVWFNFFDIGLGHGLRNKLTEALANGDKKLARVYISTTYAILCCVSFIIWMFFFIGNRQLNWNKLLNIPDVHGKNISSVVFLIFSFFCLQFVLRLIGTILTAHQKPAKSLMFDLIASVASLAAIFILTKLNDEGSLYTLAFVTGIFQVSILFVASIYYFLYPLRELRPSIKFVDFQYLKPLLGIGGKFFVIQLTAIFIFQCTNVIITRLLGPDQVTVYNISYRYFAIAKMICAIVCTPFWSAFTEAYVKSDFEWMRNITRKLNMFYLLMTGVVVVMFLFSGIFYKIWVGDKVVIPVSISLIMGLNMIFNIRYDIFILLINGTGKIRLQLIMNILSSFIFIPVALWLGKTYLLEGIVFSNLLFNLLYAVVIPIQGKMILNRSAKGVWNK